MISPRWACLSTYGLQAQQKLRQAVGRLHAGYETLRKRKDHEECESLMKNGAPKRPKTTGVMSAKNSILNTRTKIWTFKYLLNIDRIKSVTARGLAIANRLYALYIV